MPDQTPATILNSKTPAPIVNLALMVLPIAALVHVATVFRLMWLLVQGDDAEGSVLLWIVAFGVTLGLVGALAGIAFGPPPLARR